MGQPLRHQAIDQSHGAMVVKLKALRELADVHLVASGEAADREERLVLLRGESDATGRGLAETQELPQRKPKRCLVYVRLIGNRRGTTVLHRHPPLHPKVCRQ